MVESDGKADAQPAVMETYPEGNGSADQVPETWKVGDIILSLYEVKEVLGRGGFGVVYRVWHKEWNLDLAVKCPQQEKFLTDQQKKDPVIADSAGRTG